RQRSCRSALAHLQAGAQYLPVLLDAFSPQIAFVTEQGFAAFLYDLAHVAGKQKQAQEIRGKSAMKLAEVAQFAFLKMDMAASHNLFGTFAAVMNDFGCAQISYAPTCVFGSATPIQFFGEHDVAFVEAADLFVDFVPRHQC